MSDPVMTSVLFTDLVGSTALASRLGPDAAEELRQTHFGMLRGVITATGGVEVKNLGDGLMVAFTSPSRALACATGMQQATERHNHRASEPLAVRIGLSLGEAVEDDGDYFGDPVVEAARLCASASGGQILTTELVRAMVGRHATQSFVEVGPLELKGLPEPVAAVEVVWEPMASEGQVPLPTRLVAAATEALFGFFGRAVELEQLAEVQKRAFSESRLQTVLVAGEAGIGKTTLIAQAARQAHAAGVTILFGHCDEDLAVPYRPWIEALSHLVEHLGTECVDALAPLHREALARLAPSLGEPGSTRVGDADTERLVLMQAIIALLREVSAEAPMVVVLDDLHWADAASLQVLRHLAATGTPMAVTVIGTYRDTDLSRDHPLTPLLADLHREQGVVRHRMAGLDDADIVELLAAAAGYDLDDEATSLAHALRRETDGNPFFTTELLRHLGESGAIYQGDNGRWALRGELSDIGLPGSVRDVVARRVARLGEEAGRVLSIGSVIGRDFALEILAMVAESDEDELLDTLEAATTAAVVAEREDVPGTYRFTHALIQHTLYQDLSAARRQRTHHRVAEALEALAGDEPARTAELARHWVAATRPAELDKALHYVVRAADDALAALAPDDAIRWYMQGLDLAARRTPPDKSLRCRLLVGLGDAQRQAGAAEHRGTLLEAADLAREIGDTTLLVAAVLAGARGVVGASVTDEQRVDATRAALEAVGPADSSARARLLVALVESIDGREWERRGDLGTEAVAVARRVGDDSTLLAILNGSYERGGPEALDRRLAETAEAIELADRLRDPLAGCTARFQRIDACTRAVDLAEVDQRLAELSDLAESTALPLHSWQLHMSTSWRALLDGRCDDAEAAATAAFEVGMASGQPEAISVYGAQLFEIRRHQGRLAEIIELLEQAIVENPAVSGFRQALTLLYCELGRLSEARVLFAQDVANNFGDVTRDHVWLAAMLSCANAAATLQDHEAARVLYDQLAPFDRQVATVFAIVAGVTALPLGRLATLLGRYDDAEAHFRTALEIHERIRAPYWIACTQLDLVDLLLQRLAPGDQPRAREFTEEARRIAVSRGYGALKQRAESSLESMKSNDGSRE